MKHSGFISGHLLGEKILGKGHHSTFATIHNMATLFNLQGKYDDALEGLGRALQGLGKGLGTDHPDTLAVVGNMAAVYEKQGNYIEAQKLYEQELDGQAKRVGDDHTNTNNARVSLVKVIRKQVCHYYLSPDLDGGFISF